MEKIKSKKILGIGVLVGLLLFILLYGVKILNPTYTDWLMNREDLTQHFMGWEFFRKSQWSFPFGLIDGLIYPDKVSVIFMDCIPNFAIFFKIFSLFLPQNFQYFGLFGLLTFIFMAIISGLILREYSQDLKIVIIFMILLVLAPPFLNKMYVHTALASHWLILAGILLWLKKDGITTLKKLFFWNLLFLFIPGIHAYFIPMLFLILIGYILEDFFINKRIKDNVVLFFTTIFSALISMYLIGYFYGKADNNFEFGYYNANLNTFFNPVDWSRFIKNVKLFSVGQHEGFAYLGIGLIFLLLLNLNIFKNRKNIFKLLIILVSFIISISPGISIGKTELFQVNYPDIIEKMMGIFKTNGRFVWVSYYLLIILIFENICKNKNKKNIYLLYFLFVLQIIDLSPKLYEIHNKFTKKVKFESKLKSKFWKEISKDNYKIMMFMDEGIVFSGNIWDLSQIAVKSKLNINNSYIARKNIEQIKRNIELYVNKLKKKENVDDVLFIYSIPSDKIKKYNNLNYYIIDGFLVGTTRNYEKYEKYDFNNFDSKVLGGNENTEKNSEYLEVKKLGIQYGPYTQLEKGNYIIRINGINLDKAGFEAVSNSENIIISNFKNLSNGVEYEINLNKDFDNVEFKTYNSTDEIVKIKDIRISKK